MNIINELFKSGNVSEKIPKGKILIEEILKLKKEKNVAIMAHYYQTSDIQNIADYIGDSLALAQMASKVKESIILMAGVYFMGETVKIICPEKKVIVPDKNAGCSLAESCPTEKFEDFIKLHKNHYVVTYVNTTAEIKALSDITVTSSNALDIINQIPKNKEIIFAPDKNLGNYINNLTGRNMLLWDGACHVHEKFSVEKIIELKKEYPNAEVLAHPECKQQVLMIADFVGSTAAIINYTKKSNNQTFIIATESGILHELRKISPKKNFIPAPPIDSTCESNDCEYMKLNTLEKIYLSIKFELHEVEVNEQIRKKALIPIERMLNMSK